MTWSRIPATGDTRLPVRQPARDLRRRRGRAGGHAHRDLPQRRTRHAADAGRRCSLAAIADVRFDPADSALAVAGANDAGTAWFSNDGGGPGVAAAHGPWSGRVELAYAGTGPRGRLRLRPGDARRDLAVTRRRPSYAAPAGAGRVGRPGALPREIRAGTTTRSGRATPPTPTSSWSAASTCGAAPTAATTWPRSAPGGTRAPRTPTSTSSSPTPAYDGTSNRTVFFGNDGGLFTRDRPRDDRHGRRRRAVREGLDEARERLRSHAVLQRRRQQRPAARSSVARRTTARVCFDPAAGTEGWTTIFGGDGGWCAADPDRPEGLLRRVRLPQPSPQHRRRHVRRHQRRPLHQRAVLEQRLPPVGLEARPVPHPGRDDAATRCSSPRSCSTRTSRNGSSRAGCRCGGPTTRRRPTRRRSGPQWRAIKPSAGSEISALAVAQSDSDVVWVGHRNGAVFRTAERHRRRRRRGTGSVPPGRRSSRRSRYCTRITIDPADARHRLRGFRRLRARQRLDDPRRRRDLGRPDGSTLPPAPIRAVAVHPAAHELRSTSAPRSGCSPARTRGATLVPDQRGPDELLGRRPLLDGRDAGVRHATAGACSVSTCPVSDRRSSGQHQLADRAAVTVDGDPTTARGPL